MAKNKDSLLDYSHDSVVFSYYKPKLETPFFLVSDHAGRNVPHKLGDMGVSQEDWARHIAYDIGISEVGHILQNALSCTLIEQNYSRLVIDCNRAPLHLTSIAQVSDGTKILGNQALNDAQRKQREDEIFFPYHEFIEAKLEDFIANYSEKEICFVSLHSFTPEMNGQKRPWQIGLLHDHDPKSAQIMSDLLEKEGDFIIGDNQPYILTPQNDYTVPYHAARRSLPALEIEIRQDLIETKDGQEKWGLLLADILPKYWKIYRNLYL